MSASTQIFNRTKHVVKVLVGSGRTVSDLASVEAGGKYVMVVHSNATYREYTVGVDAPGLTEKFIVSSDDLCDNKCITVKEEDCKLQVQMEPRQQTSSPVSTSSTTTEAPTKSVKKPSWLRSWLSK